MWLVSCLLFLITWLSLFDVAAADAQDLYWVQPASQDGDAGIEITHQKLSTERQGLVPAILTLITNPIKFVKPFPSSGAGAGCTGRVRLDKIAEENGCKLAINGAPFNMDTGACIGYLMSNGTMYSQPESDDDVYPTFAITKDGRMGFGNLPLKTVENEGVVQAISGFQNSALLVENGVPAVSSDALIAQRTAIGVDTDGHLMFLTIDGAESRDRGMTMSELAVAFAQLGAVYAINLDGGGSTALWEGGSYVDRPTCLDTVFPRCDRRVANAVCVMA
jgi:hypothetical protein